MSMLNQNILNAPKNKFKPKKKLPKFDLFDNEYEFTLDDNKNDFELNYYNFFCTEKQSILKKTTLLENLDDSKIEDNSSDNDSDCKCNNNDINNNISNKKLCIINLLNNFKN